MRATAGLWELPGPGLLQGLLILRRGPRESLPTEAGARLAPGLGGGSSWGPAFQLQADGAPVKGAQSPQSGSDSPPFPTQSSSGEQEEGKQEKWVERTVCCLWAPLSRSRARLGVCSSLNAP